ncbi:hypothetical protein MHYP_G00070090 [Metynnis hypsauchen]
MGAGWHTAEATAALRALGRVTDLNEGIWLIGAPLTHTLDLKFPSVNDSPSCPSHILRRLISNSLKVTAAAVAMAVVVVVEPEVISLLFSQTPLSAASARADYHAYHCHRI